MFALNLFEKELATVWENLRIYLIPDPLYHLEKYTCERVRSSVIELPDNAKLLYWYVFILALQTAIILFLQKALE